MRRKLFHPGLVLAVLLILLVSAGSAGAQEATPTPTPAPENFQSCLPVQDCVTNGLAPLVDGCYTSNPACTSANHDKNAVTADEIAQRAISARKCDTRTFTRRSSCGQCYRAAALPLRFRYDGALFHGILAYATKIIQSTMHEKCDSLPSS